MALTFEMGDIVEIHSTNDSLLDGRKAMIIGVSSVFAEMAFYIIGLDGGHTYTVIDGTEITVSAITMTEHCLRKVA